MALNPEAVPPELRSLLPLAERWGIGDDYERCAAVDNASDEERAALVAAMTAAPHSLYDWLTTESQPPYSPEWAALTDLTQAYDYARVQKHG